MRAALYARVSTLNGQHPEMQLGDLREHACRRNWQIVGEYVDEGVSGSKESRPELNRLVTDAHQRKFDIVLVWKIDRFGRSLKHLVNALAELDAYGVAFASLKDNLDLSTPSGRLMFQIIGAMAEFERALIQERVKAGLHNARRNGKKLGRPRRAVDLDRITRLKTEGRSLRSIAERLGVGYGTVRMRLVQSGEYSHILSSSEFQRDSKAGRRRGHKGPSTGFIASTEHCQTFIVVGDDNIAAPAVTLGGPA